MKKYWFLKDNTYLIGLNESSIYSGSVKKYIKSELINKIEREGFPEDIFSVPFSYIKSIENPEGKKSIAIFYGDKSEEEVIIENEVVKNEFFEEIQIRLKSFEYLKEKPSIFKHAKAQFFAVLFITGIFVWTFYLANEIEKGYQYEVVGGRQGLGSIVLGLAQFGSLKVILGYLGLLSIALFALIKRLKNRVFVEYLVRK